MNILVYIRMLRIAAAVFFLAGCVPSSTMLQKPSGNLTDIRVGMTEDSVVDLVGEPSLVDPYQVGKYVFYYPAESSRTCVDNPASCTPVVFQEGRVIGVGRKWLSGSRAPAIAAPPAAVSSPEKTKKRPIDKETRREIERLERQVRQIPAARTMDNLRIYRYLLKLDPDSDRYRKKVARYEAQYRKEEDQREALRKEREERRKRQNLALRQPKGNDRLQMALENQGNGRFYVWIEYSGSEPIQISPEQFTLVCKNGRRYGCYRCRDLDASIEPGGRAEGRLSFDTYADPAAVVFSHPTAGTIRREFPDL